MECDHFNPRFYWHREPGKVICRVGRFWFKALDTRQHGLMFSERYRFGGLFVRIGAWLLRARWLRLVP